MVRLLLVLCLVFAPLFALAAPATPEPEGLWGAFVAYVAPPLATALASLAAWALYRLSTYVQSRTRNERVRAIEERVFGAVAVAVRDIEQRVRPTIKQVGADGRVTSEEAARLRAEAWAAVRAQLGQLGWADLLELFGGDTMQAHRYIERAIEAEVLELPARAPPPARGATIATPAVPAQA